MAYWLNGDAMFWEPTAGEASDGIEIDIIEQRANNDNTDKFHITLHADGYDEDGGSGRQFSPSTQPTVSNLEDNWHTIGCLWTPDGYRFHCDSYLPSWEYFPSAWDDFINGEWCTNGPEWLLFNVNPDTVVGDAGFAGPPPETYGTLATSETKMTVDWVKVYQNNCVEWKGTFPSSMDGTWNAANENWQFTDGGDHMTFTNLDECYFDHYGGTVTIANGFAPGVRSLHFLVDGYTVTGSWITLHNKEIYVTPGNTATINSGLGGAKGLKVMGGGDLILGGNNNYTGDTIIPGGSALNIRHANALGNTSDGTIVKFGGALEIQGGITVGAEALELAGFGVSNNGALRSISGNNTYAGLLTLNTNTRIRTEADSLTLSHTGTITGSGKNLQVLGDGDTTINSVIGTVSGGLYKEGDGTLTLTRANSYTGDTEVVGGMLVYGTNNVLASGDLIVGEPVWSSGTVAMQGYSDTVGAVSLIRGTITGTGTLTSTSGFEVQNGTANVRFAGSVGLTKTGTGTVHLTKNHTYTGTTTVSAGTLTYGTSNAIYTGPVNVAVNGTLNMGSYSDTVGSVSAAGDITGTGTLTTTGSFTFSNNNTISVALAGSGGLTKTNSGSTTILSGNNTYTGTTNINGGALRITHANGLGSTYYSPTVVGSQGTLELAGGITTPTEGLTISGSGYYGIGALRNVSDNNTYSGNILLAADSTIKSDSGTLTLSSGNALSGSGRDLTLGGAGNIVINRNITTGSGEIIKTGAGTVTLTGSNTYTGKTTLSGGYLVLGQNAQSRILSYGGCDIEQGKMVFNYPDQSASILSLLTASYEDGDWDSGQFLCSTADGDHGLGWVDNGSSTVTVAYVLYGDTDLDGDVDYADYMACNTHQDSYGDWSWGDFNYDGYIDATDLALLNGNYGETQGFSLEIDPVPEPSTLVLLACGLVGLLAYAWRKRK